MSATTADVTTIKARRAGFIRDLMSIAGRAARSIPRQPEVLVPAIVIPAFFFFVNTGSLENLTDAVTGGPRGGFDFRAFQLPVAIMFAVTGISQAVSLVTDIQTGYFDRLLATPIRRMTLLVGLMIADLLLVVALCLPVLGMGFLMGVEFASGFGGVLVFILIAALWGLVYAGFPYAIALKTGNPAAVNTSFIIFFPFLFLTTAFAPRQFLSDWMDTAASFNPVTYLLDGMRSLAMEGWVAEDLIKAFLAIAVIGALTMSMAFLALRGRIRKA